MGERDVGRPGGQQVVAKAMVSTARLQHHSCLVATMAKPRRLHLQEIVVSRQNKDAEPTQLPFCTAEFFFKMFSFASL